jgi:hypothetical protein
MNHGTRGLGFAASLLLVSTVALLPQAGASTPSTAAYVYIQIQGPEGAVYGFRASSTGQLSTISGSPFKPAGLVIGSNKSQLITLGETLLHSYGIASDGAIGPQLEQNPYTDYSGGACGGPSGGSAVLDHSGKYVYVLLQNGGDGACATYQSFNINSAGAFNGVGDTEVNTSGGEDVDLPSILGNESFAYANEWTGHYSGLIGFRRESSGTLEAMQFSETDPTLSGSLYLPAYPDASPTGNYVVVQLYPDNGGGDSNPPQLGSYTVNSQGNISSTNTSSNMPTSPFTNNFATTFSPSGDLFVIWADNGAGPGGNGIQIYNFNGAAPLTPYKTLLSGTPIEEVAWDSSNHLYAISKSDNKLYVFTVTPTSVTEDSSWSIGSPYNMIVVSE